MFNNLIESGSHRADLKRRGKFFMGATAFYALLLAATGVGSIYAYNARIDDTSSDLEVLAVMRFSPNEPRPERRDEPKPAASNHERQVATRVGEISVITPLHPDRVASEGAKDISARTPVVLGRFNSDPANFGGPVGTNYTSGPGDDPRGTAPSVEDGGTPPPPAHTAPTPAPPAEQKGPVRLTSNVLTGKAIYKPAPVYPVLAKTTGVQGPVTVQVLIDEQGRVLDAKVTSGHPLLQRAAAEVAYKWKFTPTVLNGQPVKVTGVVTFNFTLNN